MFWGLVLEPSKKYTQKVAQTFHISQAALDLKSCDQEPIQLVVEYENSNFVLATLSKKTNIYQVPLDLIFKAGDQVSFRTIGNGKVHLSGYHVLDDLDSMIMKGEDESNYEDEVEEMEDVKRKRKKINMNTQYGKRAKLDDENEDENGKESPRGKKLQGKKKKGKANLSLTSAEDDEYEGEDWINENDYEDLEFEDDDDDDDDDDEDDIDNDDDDDDADDDDDDDDDDDEDDEDDEEEEQVLEEENLELDYDDSDLENSSEGEKVKLDKSGNKKKLNGTALGIKGKEKSAQKLNKSKNENKKTETPSKEIKIQKNVKKNEKQSKMSDVENSPGRKGSDEARNSDKVSKTPKSEGTVDKKVLEGGVICEEIKIGNGQIAKPGRMVTVYYVGSLQSTKKQFDSVQSGPGFKFKLGKNEVIKGWDIGLNGMKVGGTRKLTIPPHLAYGAKGSPPVIPPNSTLVFTVELKGLS